MLLRMYTRWARATRLRGRARRGPAGHRGRASLGDVHVKGRYAYGHARRRARRAPAHPHLAVRRQRAPPDRVRVVRLRARARRRPKQPEIDPERPAHRHVPVVGRGRPARERHRLRGAHHAPARPASSCRARTSARRLQNKAQGDADPRGAARRAAARGAAQRSSRRCRARSATSRSAARSARTRLRPYQLVKDERTRYETGNVQAVLDGDLDAFIEAYLQWRRGSGADGRAPVKPESAGAACYPRPACRPAARTASHLAGPSLHDPLRERHQDLQGRGRRAPRRLRSTSQKGEFVFLVGPSGSGKSTFLRLLLREEVADATAASSSPAATSRSSARGRSRSCAATSAASSRTSSCCPNKTVYENVAFAHRGDRPARARRAHAGAADPRPRRPGQEGRAASRPSCPVVSSSGCRSPRAFVNRPLILLADEPTGNLDPATTVGIMRLLDRINRTGTTVVMATHDQRIVDAMRRRVIELDHGSARPRPGARRLRRRELTTAHVDAHRVLRARDAGLAAPQPADDHRRHRHRRGVARRCSAASCCCRSGSTTAPSSWKDGVELEIFMKVDATEAQIDDGRSRARRRPERQELPFTSTRSDAYEEFKRLFRDHPDLVAEHHRRRRCPTSFRVAPERGRAHRHGRGREFDDAARRRRGRRRPAKRSRALLDVTNTVRLHLHRDLARAARRRRCS